MKSIYDGFKLRQAQRNKAFWIFLVFFIFSVFTGAILFFTIDWLYPIWVSIATLIFFIWFIYVQMQPWASEKIENKIFYNFYEANRFLGLCSEKDEKSSGFYSKKAYSQAKNATVSVRRLSSGLRNSSSILKIQLSKPLTRFHDNLKTRILPRIVQRRNVSQMQSVLQGLAQIFGEVQKPISLDAIISKNEDLERYDIIELDGVTIKFRDILSKEPIRILISFASSFAVITIAVLIHSSLFQTNLWVVFGELGTFITYLIGCLALGLGIYELLRKKG